MRLSSKLWFLACAAVASLALFVGTSCNEHELAPFTNSLSAGGAELNKDGAIRTVDILFMVDDSNSMVEEQGGLNENFTEFLNRLDEVKADYQLAVVSTSLKIGSDNNGIALPNAPILFNKMLGQVFRSPGNLKDEFQNDIDPQKLMKKCSAYFSTVKRDWLSSNDKFRYDEEKEVWIPSNDPLSLDDVKDIFRCQGLTGTHGSAVERGLSTMIRSLESNPKFKRPGSLLAVVFVTDENDCSSPSGPNAVAANNFGDDDNKVQDCEFLRNIEDSCVITSSDRVILGEIQTSLGPSINVNGQMTPLREVCVSATADAREALMDYYENDPSATEYINCPEEGCANALESRDYFKQKLIEYVQLSNANYYYGVQPSMKSLSDADRIEKEKEMAFEDIIIASVINRDQGLRYDNFFPENWCSASGTQGYRYQLFSEMFNAPIYAPICCRREVFKTSDSNEIVCGQETMNTLSFFGPVLSTIGRRIGEAVAAICASHAPVTCEPSDCDPAGNMDRCPCLRGCSEEIYFEGSEHAYHVCNEFKVVVGSVEGENMATFREFVQGVDYEIDMQSPFCMNRTNSPIQIKLHKTDAGRNLVYQFPKKVSGAN